MTHHRPIVEDAGPSGPGALRLAGGWARFGRVEVLERGAAPRIVPAEEAPPEVLDRFTAPRAPIAGLDLGRPRLMGILNSTPDSFSDGGDLDRPGALRARIEAMARADILDVGGESTRPGAEPISEAEELSRVLPAVAGAAAGGRLVSIDTRRAAVARAALGEGARVVNDVSAMTFDPEMAGVVAEAGAPVILMHARGDPRSMQDTPAYDDVLLDVYDHLDARVRAAEAAGIARGRIVVDPGIGFGKTLAHNLALLRGLSLFHGLGCVVLLGASRKGFIGRLGSAPEPKDRAPGTVAVTLHALTQGVQMHRVHDISTIAQALALWRAIRSETP